MITYVNFNEMAFVIAKAIVYERLSAKSYDLPKYSAKGIEEAIAQAGATRSHVLFEIIKEEFAEMEAARKTRINQVAKLDYTANWRKSVYFKGIDDTFLMQLIKETASESNVSDFNARFAYGGAVYKKWVAFEKDITESYNAKYPE